MSQHTAIDLKVLYKELEVVNEEFPEIKHFFEIEGIVNGKRFAKKDYEGLIDLLNSRT